MKDIGTKYQSIDACLNDHICIIDNMHCKQNAHNVKLVDIELIK